MNVVTSSIGSGLTQMSFSNGLTVIFSKDTPVAAEAPGIGRIQTERYIGANTGKTVSAKFINSLLENTLS
jgi:hypothetical protein